MSNRQISHSGSYFWGNSRRIYNGRKKHVIISDKNKNNNPKSEWVDKIVNNNELNKKSDNSPDISNKEDIKSEHISTKSIYINPGPNGSMHEHHGPKGSMHEHHGPNGSMHEHHGPKGSMHEHHGHVGPNDVHLDKCHHHKCGKKGPTGPTGPTGSSSSCELVINGNTGRATPNDNCRLNIVGDDVIETIAQGNTLTIIDNSYITKYVVDSDPNNNAAYNTLDDALNAAYIDPSPHPITIILRPGVYQLLEDSLSNTKPINIIGSSFGGKPSSRVYGSSTSWGNKYWYSIQFENLETDENPTDTYILNNPSPITGEMDRFRNCMLFNNYKMVVENELMKFYDCIIEEPELKRVNGIIEVRSGLGNVQFFDCEATYYRPSSSSAQCLIYLNAGTEFTQTIIDSFFVRGDVEANSLNPIEFSVIAINNNQVVICTSSNFQINPNINSPNPVYIFGSVNNTRVTDVNLFITDTIFQGPEEDNLNIFVISDLWSQSNEIDSITIRGCEMDRMRLMRYDSVPNINPLAPQPTLNIILQSCICLERSNELFSIRVGGNSRINLTVSDCKFVSKDSKPVFEWVYALDGSDQNNIFLSLTSVNFMNTYVSDPAFPRWLKTDVVCGTFQVHDPTNVNQPLINTNGFAIFYSDATIYNYKPATATGAGTTPELFQYAAINVV